MGCSSCGTVTNGKPSGCGSGGGCSTGGCNRMNVFDWFADMPITFSDKVFNVVEISFKNGARKGYFRNVNHLDLMKGDLVVVEATQGYDIGEVSLKGELVKLQLKKNNIKDRADTIKNIVRKANPKDRLKLAEVRATENEMMVVARVVSRELGLNMKLGDVEVQGDGTKATFFYTAEDRVDFRELVKRYAKDFKLKIEMRQIGARQEAGRIGGIGSCGRELCCSTWLTDFKTVNTNTARYQNISINTDKLSGQCGRLKCCLNYELDSYLDALKDFPKEIYKLETTDAVAKLIKTEILTKTLWFKFDGVDRIFKLSTQDALAIYNDNKKGIKPHSLSEFAAPEIVKEESKYEDLVGHISLESLQTKNKKKKNKGNNRGNAPASNNQRPPVANQANNKSTGPAKPAQQNNNRPAQQNQNRPAQNNPNQKEQKAPIAPRSNEANPNVNKPQGTGNNAPNPNNKNNNRNRNNRNRPPRKDNGENQK